MQNIARSLFMRYYEVSRGDVMAAVETETQKPEFEEWLGRMELMREVDGRPRLLPACTSGWAACDSSPAQTSDPM